MLEFYQAYADYHDMATITRVSLIQEAALVASGSLVVTHADGSVHDLSGIWPRLYTSLSEAIGEEITPNTDRSSRCARRRDRRGAHGGHGQVSPRSLFEHHVISTFTGPTVRRRLPRRHVPARGHRTQAGRRREVGPLHQRRRDRHRLLELVDPVIQRERLMEQAAPRHAATLRRCSRRGLPARARATYAPRVAWAWGSTA